MKPLARTIALPAISTFIGLLAISGNFLAGQGDRTKPSGDPCAIRALSKSELQGFRLYAPDNRRYIVNKDDETKVSQVYVGMEGISGLTCITCTDIPGGPKARRYKMQPRWHPSGRWIIAAIEREKYSTPPVLGWNKSFVTGMLQSGLWTNMYAISPDGREWHQLTNFQSNKKGVADGYTGPAITSDGRTLVWSEIVDGNVLKYTFGKWNLIAANWEEHNGIPHLTNARNLTPPGMYWNEPAGFQADNERLLITGSFEENARGMDQYLFNIRTGQLQNLTNTPAVWDEHGVSSPDGHKIIFMSAYPYRKDPQSSTVTGLKTEFMMIDDDGRNLVQLTHFREPGHPEYSPKANAAVPAWSADGRSVTLSRLIFPGYDYWELTFEGPCGNQKRP